MRSCLAFLLSPETGCRSDEMLYEMFKVMFAHTTYHKR